jgi:hypothetical protein
MGNNVKLYYYIMIYKKLLVFRFEHAEFGISESASI